jgi:hypothetical protein
MQTAFQANAFQNNAFQIQSGCMDFECWDSCTWAAGSWVEGSWCPGVAAPDGGNVPRYSTTRTVDLFSKPVYNRNMGRLRREDEEIIIL